MREDMPLSEDVLSIIRRLEAAGYRADIVGGSVRDFLMGKTPEDHDMATDATPEEMKKVFASERVIETGIRHGTLTLLLHGVPYEITTYRVDGDYSDHRHPDGVSFTRSLTEDLARRDLTVNAIAYHPRFGYTDPYGGRADIKARLLRAVGDPDRRFSEDALRILRTLRFAATLGFRIEEKTEAALLRKAGLLADVAVERVDKEWQKQIGGAYAAEVLSRYRAILPYIFPELSDREPLFPEGTPPPLRTPALFVPYADAPTRYDAAMRRLHADNRRREGGVAILTALSSDLRTEEAVLTLLARLGKEDMQALLTLRALFGIGNKKEGETLRRLLAEGTPYLVSQLAVDGKDLLALGYRGRAVGEGLHSLLLQVMRGEVKNEREALLAALSFTDMR